MLGIKMLHFYNEYCKICIIHFPITEKSSHSQMYFKKGVLLQKKLQISQENTCVGVSFQQSVRAEGL